MTQSEELTEEELQEEERELHRYIWGKLRPFIPFRWLALIWSIMVIATTSSYFWGFWGFFEINFLEYVQVQDVFSRASFILIPTFLTVFSALSNSALTVVLLKGNHPKLPLYILIAPAGIWLLTIITTPTSRMDLTGAAALILAPFFLACAGFLMAAVMHRKFTWLWSLIGFMIAFIPCIFYAKGVINADRALKNTNPPQVVLNSPLDVNETVGSAIFIGRMGGFAIFAETERNGTFIIPESKIEFIHLPGR